MKRTTTIQDILQAELIEMGLDEFVVDDELVFFDDDFQFIKKAMKYDEDIQEITNRVFFHECKLSTEKFDKHFKKGFINKFLNREIGRQTVEDFSSQVTFTFLANEEYINRLYEDLDSYLQGKSMSTTTGTQEGTSDNRQLMSELPQNNVNLNVDDTILDYGNTNSISRNKNKQDNDTKTENSQYNLDSLLKLNGLFEEIYIKFDINCFKQTW